MNVYLDDKRNPTTDRDWVVVRSMAEFQELVLERGTHGLESLEIDLR